MSKTTRIPKTACASCGYSLDRTTNAYEDAVPSTGDASICIACGALSIFDANLTLRKPTIDEREFWAKEQRVTDIQLVRAYLVGDKLKGKHKHE